MDTVAWYRRVKSMEYRARNFSLNFHLTGRKISRETGQITRWFEAFSNFIRHAFNGDRKKRKIPCACASYQPIFPL
jgi:hypothetical protein